MFNSRSYITIQDLDIRYAAIHGIFVDGYDGNVSDLTIQRNNLSYIGGCYQSGTTREGDGINLYDRTSNVIIQYNTLDNVYDGAIVLEGAQDNCFHVGISVHHNIVTNSEYGAEIYHTGTNSGLTNIFVYNNTFYNNGGGWSHAQRPDPRGTGLMMWNSTNGGLSNCFFRNNIVHTSANQHIDVYDPTNDLAGWTIDYNDWYPDGAVAFLRYTTATNSAGWETATSQDAHSIVADPKLVSTSDFHLQSTSPAINAGVNVGLTQDFDGNPISGLPDIGAFEFMQKPATPQHLRFVQYQ